MSQKLVTRFQTEALDEIELRSKFANLQQVLIRTQQAVGERAIALASLETVEAEMNRRRVLPRMGR